MFYLLTVTNDWLQEEYDKIRKNQLLLSLQAKLEAINKQKESFNEMKLRVSKVKSNSSLNNPLNSYVHKMKKDIEIEKSELIEENEKEEDRDLVLEEYKEEVCYESDGEVVEDDNKLDNTFKV